MQTTELFEELKREEGALDTAAKVRTYEEMSKADKAEEEGH